VNTSRRAALLTGERGAGKTTLCLSLAAELPGVRGIACPAVFDAKGNKTGFRCVCLQSGEGWELGSLKCGGAAAENHTPGDGCRGTGSAGAANPQTGKYSFNRAGIQRGIDCIRDSLKGSGSVTVIDEIGPLELLQKEGFAAVLPLLREAGDLLLVVRSAFVEEVLPYINGHQSRIYDLTETNRVALKGEISRFFTDPR
jgi:nucleoside-triphosphatase THEP1